MRRGKELWRCHGTSIPSRKHNWANKITIGRVGSIVTHGLPVLGTAQVAPDLQDDVVLNEPDAAIAQDNLDPRRVSATRRLDVRIGAAGPHAGRVRRPRVAV